MIRTAFLFAGMLLLITPAATRDADSELLSYDRALTMALANNLQIAIADNNQVIALTAEHPGRAGLLPRVDLTATSNYQNGDGTAGESNSLTSNRVQVQFNQTLFDGLAGIYRLKRLKAGKVLGKLEARDRVEQVLLNVSSRFFAAASAYEQLRIAHELVSISRERLTRAEKRSAFGRATTLDVLAARVDFAADQVILAQAQFLWHEARRDLNLLLNREIEHPFLIDTSVQFIELDSLEKLIAEGLANNAGYLAARERLRQASLDVRIARSPTLPRLDLTASYGSSQSVPGWAIKLNDGEETLSIGLNLQLTLFDGFQNTLERKITRLNRENQALLVEEFRLTLIRQITGAVKTYEYNLLVLDLEQEYLKAAQLNFERTRELYRLGQVTTTQFREAQINLIQSKSNLATAKFAAKISETELLQLSGRLNPRD